MKMILNVLTVVLLFSQCNPQLDTELSGTKWEYVFEGTNPVLKDVILFKAGNKYEFYNAENSYTYQGVYFIEGDTLNMVEVNVKEENKRVTPRHIKAKIEDGELRLLSFEKLEKQEWQSKPYSPPEDYFFTKVE